MKGRVSFLIFQLHQSISIFGASSGTTQAAWSQGSERFHWPCDGSAKRRFEWIVAHPFRWTTRAWNFHAMLLESKRRECRALRCPIGWQKSNSQQHNCTAIVGVNRRSFWVPSLNIWLSKVVTQKQSDSASTKHLKKQQNVQILTKFVAKS